MLLLLSCATPELARVVTTPAPVSAPEVTAPAPVVIPLQPGWNTGWMDHAAIRRSPTEAWARQLAGPITAPLLTDGKERIFAIADGKLTAFDRNGSVQWTLSGGLQEAIFTNDRLLVGTEAQGVWEVDPATGTVQTRHVATGAVRGGLGWLGGQAAWASTDGMFERGGGVQVAGVGRVVGAMAYETPFATDATDSAAVSDIAYVATLEGELVAIDANGVRWRSRLPGPASYGVLLDADRIYVPYSAVEAIPGGIAAFSRAGAGLWTRQTTYGPGAGAGRGALLYLPDKDGHLYALDAATGAVTWKAEGYGEFTSRPLCLEESVYVGNGDGRLYRIDTDGGVAWSINLGAAVTGDPIAVGGRLVVGLANGRVIALQEGY